MPDLTCDYLFISKVSFFQMLRFGKKFVTKSSGALQAAVWHGQVTNLIIPKALSTSANRCTKRFDGALPVSEIPGPLKLPFVGNAFQVQKAGGTERFNQALMTLQKEYGKIFQIKFGHERLVCISDPDMIEDVYRNEGKYPRREKTFPAWDKYHKKHHLPIGVFLL